MNFNYFDAFLTIATNDIETSVNFYSQHFQQQPTIYRPIVYAEYKLKNIRIAIFQPKLERQAEFNNLGSSMSICLEVEDLTQAIATLTQMGYPPPGEIIEASHGKEIYACDPAGNRLILHQSKSG